MAPLFEEYAWEHRRLSHENGTKIIYFSKADCAWIIADKEGRLSNSQPPSDSQRLLRGAGAGARRRVPVLVPAPPVVQEPEFKFSKKVLKNLAVKKDVNGNSVLVRVITRRKKKTYKPVVPIEQLCDTIAMHHRDSVGYRGEKKLWNFLTTMAPTELAPDEDGNPVFCFGLAGFERDGLKEKFLKECPVPFLAKHQQKIANTRLPKGESKEFAVGQAVLLFPPNLGRNGSFAMVTHSIPCRVVRPRRNGQYQLQCNAGVLEDSYKRRDLRKANAAWEKKLAFTAEEVGQAETVSLSAAVASMGGRITDVRCGCRGKCSSNCPCKRARALCGTHCKCCHGKKGANCGNSKALGGGAKRRKA